MRKIMFLLLLSFLAGFALAYTLSIKVTVTEDTLSVGANVSLVTGGVEVASGRTGNDGIVKFNVSNGSYFALLKSTIYPLHVSLIQVRGDTDVTLTKRQLVSYANAYGQIFGPTNFSNASVSAYQDGLVAKRVVPDEHGFYILSFVPDGTYDMVFEANGFEKKTERAYLAVSDFTEVNAKLSRQEAPQAAEPILYAPSTVPQSQLIELELSSGGVPLAGETIIAETPAGKVELVTNTQGKASINAAQSGLYRFTFGTLTALTSVPSSKPSEKPKEEPSQVPSPSPIIPAAPAAAPAPSAPQGGEIVAAFALFFLLLFVGLLALLVWVKLVAPALAKQKAKEERELREQVKHEHPHPAHKKKHHGKK